MIDLDEDFVQALENRDLETLKKTPKVDLHNHWVLGGNRGYIENRTGVKIPNLKERFSSMVDMHKWVERHVGFLYNSIENRRLCLEACFNQARGDGITVLEIGDDVWANSHYYNGKIDALIEFHQEAHKKIAPEIDFRFQIGLSRHCSLNLLEQWAEPFFQRDCFYSIDLYGDELAQPIKNFKSIFRRAKEKGLILKAHVGEWGDADSVKEAVEELELDEVQHGISAAESTGIMNWLIDHNIQLNICPSSNVMLNRVTNLKSHPIKKLFDHGVKVTINSDDILVFGQSVSQEYLSLYNAGLFSAQELNTIRQNGLKSRLLLKF